MIFPSHKLFYQSVGNFQTKDRGGASMCQSAGANQQRCANGLLYQSVVPGRHIFNQQRCANGFVGANIRAADDSSHFSFQGLLLTREELH